MYRFIAIICSQDFLKAFWCADDLARILALRLASKFGAVSVDALAVILMAVLLYGSSDVYKQNRYDRHKSLTLFYTIHDPFAAAIDNFVLFPNLLIQKLLCCGCPMHGLEPIRSHIDSSEIIPLSVCHRGFLWLYRISQFFNK